MDVKINRRMKRFHDVWGHRNDGNMHSSAWLIGTEANLVDDKLQYVDRVKAIESDYDRYVYGNKSIEKLRK